MSEERQMNADQRVSFDAQLEAALEESDEEAKRGPPSGYEVYDANSVVLDAGVIIAIQMCFLLCVCMALDVDPLVVTRILGLENNMQPLSPAQQQRVCDLLGVDVCEHDAGNENRRKMIRSNRPTGKVVHLWLKLGHYVLLVPEDPDIQPHDHSEVEAQVQAPAQVEADLEQQDEDEPDDYEYAFQLQVEEAESWTEFQAAQVEAYLEQQQQEDILEAQRQSEVRAAQVEADRRAAAVSQQQQEDHEFAVRLQADILEAQRQSEVRAAQVEADRRAAQILADNETARVQQLHEDYKFARMLSPRAC